MRSTCEIIADLKDGKEVPYEELKMACLVQSSIIFFYQQDTKSLLKGGMAADLVERMNYKDNQTSSKKMGWPTWYWNAIKKDPLEWLGQKYIPGTDEWKEMHSTNMKIFEHAMKNTNGGRYEQETEKETV